MGAPGFEAHAVLAPSSAHIWTACPGSVAMRARYPDPVESEKAREGTAAHWYLTETLRGVDVAAGALAPNGVPITAEMVDCAQAMLVDVRDTWQTCAREGGDPQMYVEQRVAMGRVHPDNWGAPDAVIIDAPRRVLFVWVYKFGHRYVDPAENWQLIEYAVGALDRVPSHEWPGWTVSLNIAQPRNYHRTGPMREWQTTGAALLDTYVPRLYEAAKAAMQPDAAMQTGEHCRDCSARHACPALQRASAYAIDVAHYEPPVDLPPHALGLELRHINDAIDRLNARKAGLDEMALGSIRSGVAVPFFTARHAVGRERWTTPAAEVFALGDAFGVDLRRAPEPVTPNQARGMGVDGAVISAYAERPRGALRLEPVDDNAARLAFE